MITPAIQCFQNDQLSAIFLGQFLRCAGKPLTSKESIMNPPTITGLWQRLENLGRLVFDQLSYHAALYISHTPFGLAEQ